MVVVLHRGPDLCRDLAYVLDRRDVSVRVIGHHRPRDDVHRRRDVGRGIECRATALLEDDGLDEISAGVVLHQPMVVARVLDPARLAEAVDRAVGDRRSGRQRDLRDVAVRVVRVARHVAHRIALRDPIHGVGRIVRVGALAAVFVDEPEEIAVRVEEEPAREAALGDDRALPAKLVVRKRARLAQVVEVPEHAAVDVVLERHSVAARSRMAMERVGQLRIERIVVVGVRHRVVQARDREGASVRDEVSRVVRVLPGTSRPVVDRRDAILNVRREREATMQAVRHRGQRRPRVREAQRIAVAIGDREQARGLSDRAAISALEPVQETVLFADDVGSVHVATEVDEDSGRIHDGRSRRDRAPRDGGTEKLLAAGPIDPAHLVDAARDLVESQEVIEAMRPPEAERTVDRIPAVVAPLEDERQTAPLDHEIALDVIEVARDHVDGVHRRHRGRIDAVGRSGRVDHDVQRGEQCGDLERRLERRLDRCDECVAAARDTRNDQADVPGDLILGDPDGTVPA